MVRDKLYTPFIGQYLGEEESEEETPEEETPEEGEEWEEE